MGITLEFLVGDKREIVDGIDKENFDVVDKVDELGLNSNFGLHITPRDLDILFETIAESLCKVKIGLRENLDTSDCFCDHPDRGAFYVKDVVKELVSTVRIDEAGNIAKKWYDKLALIYPNEELGKSSDAESAIEDLVRICKVAVKNKSDLVHWWVE